MSPYYNCVEQSYLDLANSTTAAGSASAGAASSASPSSKETNSTAASASQGNNSSTQANNTEGDGGPSVPGGNNSWAAPHRVVYANLATKSESGFPDPDQLGDFNRLIISVYLADGRKAFDVSHLLGIRPPAPKAGAAS